MSEAASIALAWLQAVSRRDRDGLIVRSHPEIAIVGPKGTATGLTTLERWFEGTRVRMRPHTIYEEKDLVLVLHAMEWLDADGAVTGHADNASLFTITDDRVTAYARDDAPDPAARHGFSGPGLQVMVS